MSTHALPQAATWSRDPKTRKQASTIVMTLNVGVWLLIGVGLYFANERWTNQQKLNKLLIAAIEESGTGVLIVDSRRNVLMANAAASKLFNKNPVGRDLLELASAPRKAELNAAYTEAVAESASETVRIEHAQCAASRDKPHFLNIMLRPAKTTSGDVVLVTVTPEKLPPGVSDTVPRPN